MDLRIAVSTSSFASQDEKPLQMLRDAGAEVVTNPHGRRLTKEEIIRHLDGVHGLLAGLEPLDRDVLSRAQELRAVTRVGIGMTNVDVDAARELGIRVSNTPDGPTQAVAECTLGAMIATCRGLPRMSNPMHEGRWEKHIGLGVGGAKVLVVGYGRIGRKVGELLQALGAELLVADPAVPADELTAGERLVPLEEGLKECDIVTLHAAGNEVVLGPKQFASARDGLVLLNSARGELVDEPALVEALEHGKVAAAWFDAFPEEPYSGPLTRYPQVLLSPHVSTYTRQCRLKMETDAVRRILTDLGVRT